MLAAGMLESDRTLLDAFRRGDRAALAAVFRHYAQGVFTVVRAGVVVEVDGARVRLGNGLPQGEVEALVQETFTRAFTKQARASYDGVRPYDAWLATIARNALIDRARVEQKHKRVAAVDDLGDFADADARDPAWHAEHRQIMGVVEQVKKTLDDVDAGIFRCRMEQGMSFSEAAKALGLSEAVVRRRDTRLRARLLDLLQNEGFLTEAKVRIGKSLLLRKARADPP